MNCKNQHQHAHTPARFSEYQLAYMFSIPNIFLFSNTFLLDSGLGGWEVMFSLFLLAFVKFALAAFAAMPNPDLSFWDIIVSVGGGALLSVVVYTYFGKALNRWVKQIFKRKKPSSFKRRRQIYSFWKKYGLVGTAFLAPVLSPMISVGIAVSFQENPRKIMLYVGLSIIFWTFVFAFFREGVLQIIDSVRTE